MADSKPLFYITDSVPNSIAMAIQYLCGLIIAAIMPDKLIQCIEQGKLNGFSLGSVSDKAYTPKYWFINKSLNYVHNYYSSLN